MFIPLCMCRLSCIHQLPMNQQRVTNNHLLSQAAPRPKPRIAGHPNKANATAKPKASASMAESTMYPGKRFAGGMGTSGAIGQMCGPTTKAVRPITIVTMSIHHDLLMIFISLDMVFISLNLLQLQAHGASLEFKGELKRCTDLRLDGVLCSRKHIACGRRTRYVLRTRDSQVHPSRVNALKHFFSRSGVALRDAELLECFRPPCARDRKGFYVEFQDFTQLSGHFICAYHRTQLDDAMP